MRGTLDLQHFGSTRMHICAECARAAIPPHEHECLPDWWACVHSLVPHPRAQCCVLGVRRQARAKPTVCEGPASEHCCRQLPCPHSSQQSTDANALVCKERTRFMGTWPGIPFATPMASAPADEAAPAHVRERPQWISDLLGFAAETFVKTVNSKTGTLVGKSGSTFLWQGPIWAATLIGFRIAQKRTLRSSRQCPRGRAVEIIIVDLARTRFQCLWGWHAI